MPSWITTFSGCSDQTRHQSFDHNLCMRLWISNLAPTSRGGRWFSGPGSIPDGIDPSRQCGDDGPRKSGRLLDDDGRGTDLADDGGHPRLAGPRKGPYPTTAVGKGQVRRKPGLEELGQPSASRGLVAEPGVVGGRARSLAGDQPESEVHLGPTGICLRGLNRTVGVMVRGDVGPVFDQ